MDKKLSFEKLPQSVLEELDVKELIGSRKISPEDFYILEELAKMSKRLLIMDFHNFFSFNRENSKKELEKLLVSIESKDGDPIWEQRKAMYGVFIKLLEKYPWTTVWNIASVFERRK